MRFLDTNIILRYLTKDDEHKAAACFALLQRAKTGEEELAITEAMVTELVYVLSSRAHYHLSHEEVRSRLTPILTLRGLRLPKKRLYLRALDLYGAYPFLDFEDAITIAYMENLGITDLYSYDADFDRIPLVRRLEP